MDETEDRRVRPNPEGQSQYGRRCEARILAQDAPCVANILAKSLQIGERGHFREDLPLRKSILLRIPDERSTKLDPRPDTGLEPRRTEARAKHRFLPSFLSGSSPPRTASPAKASRVDSPILNRPWLFLGSRTLLIPLCIAFQGAMSGTAGVGTYTRRLPSECAVAQATPDAGVLPTTLRSEIIVELESQVITPVLPLNVPPAKSALEFTRAKIAGPSFCERLTPRSSTSELPSTRNPPLRTLSRRTIRQKSSSMTCRRPRVYVRESTASEVSRAGKKRVDPLDQ